MLVVKAYWYLCMWLHNVIGVIRFTYTFDTTVCIRLAYGLYVVMYTMLSMETLVLVAVNCL
jgi:hypothetical protein